ncbi:flagellar assembly protein A [Rugamonas sp.]|uniref:flagellar assembly protein A n=1 Tax=Rugamonas sp. TaxID=1926287 RepID=UPI0025F44DC6|nr:flagellar assembly protein A [Rugamonas sp.]
MSSDISGIESPSAAPAAAAAAAASTLPSGVLRREDGLYVDAAAPPAQSLAAVHHVYASGAYFSGLDYVALMRALYGVGAPAELNGLTRLASQVLPLAPQRRALYKNIKLRRDSAEYFFQLLYTDEEVLPDGTVVPERPLQLDADELVAELWNQGVRFGVDMAAVRAAIAGGKSERITVARQLDPTPGVDAQVVEVTPDLHRSDAPRARADGRIDLLSFQNRFPQIKQGLRLLKKQPPLAGHPGVDLAGRPLPAAPSKDLELGHWAGAGTAVERHGDEEFLVATLDGFLNVDAKSSRISVTDKIVSTEGVSGRTTGNLELAGAYEEFGDVQELRDVVGGDITVHGDVYGHIQSRGGAVVLGRNLVGGTIANAAGDISVAGVASAATIASRDGTVTVARAENCVIAATVVVIEHASNCEIVADTIRIGLAEGCALAARSVEMETCGPRKNSEMLVWMLVRDVGQFGRDIADLQRQADAQQALNAACQRETEQVAGRPDLRRYLALAAKLRTQELLLTAQQGQHLKKIAAAVGPDLQALKLLNEQLRVGQTRHTLLLQQVARLMEQRREAGGRAHCGIERVDGDTRVRTMALPDDGAAALYRLAPRDIRLRLRGGGEGAPLFDGATGSFDWHLDPGRSA